MGGDKCGDGFNTCTNIRKVGSCPIENITRDICHILSWIINIIRDALEKFLSAKTWEGLWSHRWPQLILSAWSGWQYYKLTQKKPSRNCTWPWVLRDCIQSNISSDLSPHNETFDLDNVTFITPYFFVTDGALQCAGFNTVSQEWRCLRSLEHLPEYCKPDLDLFKEYLVCIRNGLLCMNVSKSTQDKLIIVNLLTGKWKLLPPLNHRRNPVLMHLLVDASKQHFQVIVAGSNRAGDEHLSRITEVFDSSTGEWKRTGDLPGPDFALNEYQSGVYYDGRLYCIAFLDEEQGRGILQYNLSKAIWLKNWTYPIPFASNSTILQLLESWGQFYLFSEQENDRKVEHFVDKVELNDDANGGGTCRLKNVVRTQKTGGPSLEAYPEFSCMPYSDRQVCIFNALDHSGLVYDVENEGQVEELPAPPAIGFGGDGFFSLNPMSFTVELNQKLP